MPRKDPFIAQCGAECQVVHVWNPLQRFGCLLCVDADGNATSSTFADSAHFRKGTKCIGQQAWFKHCKGAQKNYDDEMTIFELTTEVTVFLPR